MTEQNITSWIEKEKQELGAQTETVFERLPALKLAENVITEITIDFSNKFQVYADKDMKGNPVTKAIIPVLEAGVKKNWWLNKKNPAYRQLLDLGKEARNGALIVKILRTGQQANTKYVIVK